MVAARCPRCDDDVALHDGRPQITSRGVELWHSQCWDMRDVPLVAVAVAPPILTGPSRRVIAWTLGAVSASALIAIGFGHYVSLEAAPPVAVSLPSAEPVPPGEAPLARTIAIAREPVPPREAHVETALEARYPVPATRPHAIADELTPILADLHMTLADLGPLPGEDSRPLDEVFPSLRGWTHPVTDSPELMPELAARHFGARRFGIMRAECGEGHCGIDLDGPRGRPVVAVAAGRVVRVEHSELGIDGRSGRYVRIEHEDGTLTAYMHLDEIADQMRVGDLVTAGQYVGTLGATATFESVPHLHFSLEIPNHPGQHGDNTDTHYVDPAPFLVRASIQAGPRDAAVASAHHVAKPAS